MAEIVSLQKHNNLDGSVQEWFGFDKDQVGVGRDVPVVWVKYFVEKDGRVFLWSIETRPGYRNRGYASKVLKLVKDFCEVKEIFHKGGYTPEGFKYVLSQVTWVANKYESDEEPRVQFNSMDFVEEWRSDYVY